MKYILQTGTKTRLITGIKANIIAKRSRLFIDHGAHDGILLFSWTMNVTLSGYTSIIIKYARL